MNKYKTDVLVIWTQNGNFSSFLDILPPFQSQSKQVAKWLNRVQINGIQLYVQNFTDKILAVNNMRQKSEQQKVSSRNWAAENYTRELGLNGHSMWAWLFHNSYDLNLKKIYEKTSWTIWAPLDPPLLCLDFD